MYYPEELVEEIRERNDIVDVISGYVKLQKKGGSYFGLCPFHNEKSPSFSVSQNKQMYYCFGCGAGGNVITFIMEYEKFTFAESIKYLADRAGVALPEVEYSREAREKADLRNVLFEINKKAATYFYYQLKGENGANARAYFEKRKLSEETINRFGLGYSNMYSDDLYKYMKKEGYSDKILKESGLFTMNEKGVYDKFWNRVMYPIMDINNKVIGFGGRVMGDGEPKYLNSPETMLFDKSRNLYGLNIARTSRKPNLIICEGYMDVIALHQAGFNQAVASLGTALTTGHAMLLKRYTSEVLLTYDSDGAGVKAALRAIPILKEAGLRIRVINMRPYKDPDEFIKALGAEEFQKRIDTAVSSFMYEIDIMEQQHDLKDPESKTEFYNAVARKLSEFTEPVERNNYIQAVCDKYFIEYDSFRKLVNDYGEKFYVSNELKRQQQEAVTVKKAKDDGVKKAQKILLTWLIDEPEIYGKIKQYISVDDFIEPLYHDVAAKLFEQLENGRLNPASIISTYESEEEHKEVAGLFNEELSRDLSLLEREKALNETIIKVKKNRVDFRSRNATTADELKELVREQAELNKLSKMHISLK
ncbi:MAG: DNA primase [Thermoflexaceae bacterium]|nr:DNA primase [Thermoflexaceae bacterium]